MLAPIDDLDAVDLITGAQYLDQPRGIVARLVRGHVGSQDDRKLVAAEPGHEIVAANLRPQPVGHQPQQAVAHRVAERIVDVLEQIEVDAQHRHSLVPGLALVQRLLEAILIKLPVRQICQAIMVGHIGDPRLGLAPLGDVDNGDQIAVAALEGDAPSERQHLNFAAVGLEMPPVAPGVIGIANLLQGLGMAHPFILGQISCSFMRKKVARLYP